MTAPKPHYLLFCDGNVSANGESANSQRGRWRFVLEDLVSGERIEATDQENGCAPDRSALISVLRGLEALEQPSRVTLVTTSRYVTRGLQYGLSEWRENDYSWEHFGAVQLIRNADIWKRIDRALAYHQVQCRWMAQEGAAEPKEPPLEIQTIESSSRTNVACVESVKSSTRHDTHRRSQSVSGVRTNVSTNKYQRVYVDTPLSNTPPSSDGCPIKHRTENRCPNVADAASIRADAGSIGHDVNLPHDAKLPIDRESAARRQRLPLFFQGFFSRLKSFTYRLLLPIRLVCRGPVWLCSHFWDAILAIDEWLESFLRCLFLLDPSKRPTRR